MKWLLLLALMVSASLGPLGSPTEIPDKVQVRRGGKSEVFAVRLRYGTFTCGESQGSVGCTSCKDRVITVTRDQELSELRSSLRHEVMHALTGCSPEMEANYMPEFPHLHRAIYLLSKAETQFEQENPKYVRFMTWR